MSRLDQLIQNLCPHGVPYLSLAEASLMERGTSITRREMQEGSIPVVSGGREPAYFCNRSNREADVITVAGTGARSGFVQYWDIPIFVCDAFSIRGREAVSTKYLYHCLLRKQDYIFSKRKGGGVRHVTIGDIQNMRLPIPPLPVQEEIVRILDNYTAITESITSELMAELKARRQQYDFVRDSLLEFPELNETGAEAM